jgi:hypothetical protein
MRKARIVSIPLKDIETDPVSEMLAKGDALKPYLAHYMEVMRGKDGNQTLKAIADLPKGKRYLHRVRQCLDWALADFDDETAKLDMPYMVEDLEEMQEVLSIRLYQLRSLIATLRG